MMKRYRRVSASQYIYISLIVILLAVLGFGSMAVMQRIEFTDHFVLPWSAGRLWLLEGVSPYDQAVTALAEKTLNNSSYLGSIPDSAVLIDPVINLIFYIPFSLIPYEAGRAAWMVVLVLALGLIGYLGLELSGWKISLIEKISVILFIILWLPGVNVVLKGRLSPIVILVILFGINLILREQDTAAGFILSLAFGSLPTTGLIIILLILWSVSKRRWSIITAYFSGVAFLLTITLLLLPSWVLNWVRILFDLFGNWDWVSTPLMDLAAILPGISSPLSIFLHVSFAIYSLILLITLMGKTEREFTWKVLMMMVVSYLFHVTASVNQLFFVIPAMFMFFRYCSERWRLFGRIFSWVILLFIFTGSWLLFNPEISFDLELSMPVLSIGLPLLVFIGMIWIRWWALRIPRLPFEPRQDFEVNSH
jgi:hypothetical protein